MGAGFLERPEEQERLAKAIAGELEKLQISKRAAAPSLSEVSGETLYQHSLTKLRSSDQLELAKEAAIESMIRRSDPFRILCLCGTPPDNPNALPMWAHYAENHAGFALGFDAKHPWFPPVGNTAADTLCRRVTYKTTRHEVDDPDEQGVFFSKARCWSYEDEHRIVKNISRAPDLETATVDALAPFPARALISITLGARCHSTTIRKVSLMLRNVAFRHVRLYYGAMCTDTYRIRCSTEPPSLKAREIMDKVYGRRTNQTALR